MAIKLITDNILWENYVDSSPFGTVFHKWDFLEIVAKYTNLKLFRYGIYRGDELIAIFPFFYGRTSIFRTLLSPPPKLLIPNLGFIIGKEFENLKQNKKESILRDIISGVNEINNLYPSDYLSISLVPGLIDIREFIWSGYEIKPYYTYSLSLSKDVEEIFRSFPADTCKQIRNSQKNNASIIKSDNITELLKGEKLLYEKQGLKFPIHISSYLMDIINKFPNNIILYQCVSNEAALSSILMIEYKKAHTWVGAYTPEKGSNHFFIWEIMKQEKIKGYNELELIGANTKHLCRFKAYFNPTVQIYFKITKENMFARFAKFAKNMV